MPGFPVFLYCVEFLHFSKSPFCFRYAVCYTVTPFCSSNNSMAFVPVFSATPVLNWRWDVLLLCRYVLEIELVIKFRSFDIYLFFLKRHSEHAWSTRWHQVRSISLLWLAAWLSGEDVGLLLTNWATPDLWLTCDHFVDKVSAMGQLTRPTQPSIPPGSVNE